MGKVFLNTSKLSLIPDINIEQRSVLEKICGHTEMLSKDAEMICEDTGMALEDKEIISQDTEMVSGMRK